MSSTTPDYPIFTRGEFTYYLMPAIKPSACYGCDRFTQGLSCAQIPCGVQDVILIHATHPIYLERYYTKLVAAKLES